MTIIEEIGATTAPEGAEPYTVAITARRATPKAVSCICVELELSPNEAVELASLLIAAAKSLGAKVPT